MKLPALNTNSKNAEVNAVCGRISDAYHQKLDADALLAPLFNEIDPLIQGMTAAIKRIKAESDLAARDKLRNKAHHALFFVLQGFRMSDLDGTMEAAAMLMTILDNYGLAITEENYDEKSADLDSLLLDLKSPQALAAIAIINECAALVASLQTKQNSFKAARLAFQQERGKEQQKRSATIMKFQLVKLINEKLIPVLGGALVSNPATYGEFGAIVAQIIATNNETVKQRRSPQAEPVANE